MLGTTIGYVRTKDKMTKTKYIYDDGCTIEHLCNKVLPVWEIAVEESGYLCLFESMAGPRLVDIDKEDIVNYWAVPKAIIDPMSAIVALINEAKKNKTGGDVK